MHLTFIKHFYVWLYEALNNLMRMPYEERKIYKNEVPASNHTDT